MFKKWHYGVNNYVLELEQLQTRGSVQNRSKKRGSVPPWLRACRTKGSRFVPDLPGVTAAQPLARSQGVGPVVLDKSRMHGFAGVAVILFAIGGTPSAGARGRRTLLVGDLACAILRRVLCHAGNDGGRKGRRR
jgi:hypothetical protein